MKQFAKPIAWISMFSLVLVLAACNTTEGVGEDIEEVGESIEDAADDD